MPRRSVRVALASAVVVTSALPGCVGVAPATAAPRAAAKCGTPLAPVEPDAKEPWPQQRYAPERLEPLASGRGIIVAVIDSGVDAEHVQLKDQLLGGADFLDNGPKGTRDCVGHGTGVASIIAADASPGIAFRGLAPHCKILPVRVTEQESINGKAAGRQVSPAIFAQAIRWAVDHDADILNFSVVINEDNAAVREAIAYAVRKDVVVVAAAGNLDQNGAGLSYPAAYDGVLGVGAIGPDGTRSSFSRLGPYVDLVAPGDGVLVAAPGRGHHAVQGTSYAAPFVSATAALIREYRPELSATQVADRIIATTDPAPNGGHNDAYGSGVLNPYRAVTETGAASREQPAGALLAGGADSTAAAREGRRAAAREKAWWVAGIAGGLASVLVLLAVVLPSGARRRWRPAAAAPGMR